MTTTEAVTSVAPPSGGTDGGLQPAATSDDVSPTIAACATTRGGQVAVLRLSGTAAFSIANAAGLPTTGPWRWTPATWPLITGGECPVRLLACPGPRSFTGCDLVEITLPGSSDLIDLALERLYAVGAQPAPPGGFVRQAVANGRFGLAEAEGILAVVSASDAAGARDAVRRLGGRLAGELAEARNELLEALATIEAGLDFADDAAISDDARRAAALRIAAVRDRLRRWAFATDGVDAQPTVCLAGPPNAGKSALYTALTGEPALVSSVPGTTRDVLQAPWIVNGRTVLLLDTPGWLESGSELDTNAVATGRRQADAADLILACSAPDAALPGDHGLDPQRTVVVATKCDQGPADPRAQVAVSSLSGEGLDELAALVGHRLAASGGRQERTISQAALRLERCLSTSHDDLLRAEDLRQTAEDLADLLGETTPDDVLDGIFSRFCVGK